MSGFTTIMDMFRGSQQPAQVPQAAPTAQGQQLQAPDPATAMNGAPQPNPAGVTGEPNNGGLDQFKDLFAAPTPEQIAAQGKFDPSTLFAGLEPAKVQEAVAKMSFTNNVTAEQLQQIQAGGEGAMQALTQVMNSTSQATMAQAMLANAEMIKQAMGTVSGTLDTRINAVSRQHAIKSTMHEGNTMLSNPAVQPMVDALTQAFSMKNPQATPQQIKESVQTYMTHAFQAVNPQSSGQEQQQVPAEFDFSSFLGPNN